MDARPKDSFFLPDFCALPVVTAVVLLSELFAFIIALAPLGPASDFWTDLAMISLFVQWVTLVGAALLCLARPALARMDSRMAALIAWLLLVTLVALFSLGATRFAAEFALSFATGPAEFVLRNMAIGAIVSAITLRYFYLQHQWEQRLQAESEARIQALQARIRPHFLFNSMNTIASLTRTDPEAAEAAIEDLADLFRASLADARRLITLEEELALCARYLHMEGLRLGARLAVTWGTDALPKDAQLPALTLQPLVENAVHHGIEPLPAGGTIHIEGAADGPRLRLRVRNPVDHGAGQARGHRLAMDNVRARLGAHFGTAAALESREENGMYLVELTLPYRKEGS
ncbi:MAG: sensor histidine kinase [Thiohalomonadaceae bacterium]